MKKQNLQTVQREDSLEDKLEQVDNEFKDFLASLSYKREFGPDKLRTFSPLDAVADFEQYGIQSVREVTREEMLEQDAGINKLLANMLDQCQPGALSEEDVKQITGINGREVHAGL